MIAIFRLFELLILYRNRWALESNIFYLMCNNVIIINITFPVMFYFILSENNHWFLNSFSAHPDFFSELDIVCVLSCSVMSNSATPWIVAHQAPLSMGFPRQEYWSGLLFPSPRESSWLRDQIHISCISCTGRQILYHRATWEARAISGIQNMQWG